MILRTSSVILTNPLLHTTVYSNALYLPRYKVGSTGKKATLENFEDSIVVNPLTMVKRHVASNHVRSTPSVPNTTGITQPHASLPTVAVLGRCLGDPIGVASADGNYYAVSLLTGDP